ncbi:MAG: TraR/DksA C4-type zinc finger protein [Chloroflexi bacterium]|nr:TraR/DksA C4-type zinc finger protein [Chloroflexota bacterium]
MMTKFESTLQKSASLHKRLCPKQVLGVRMGMYAGEILGLNLPRADKRLLVIAETDGCLLDGIFAATGCWPGRRTLRIEDYGKVAATFVDTQTGKAARILPRSNSRELAILSQNEIKNNWEAYLAGYQQLPTNELLNYQSVCLSTPLESIISKEGLKAACSQCGDEIINQREVIQNGITFCRACAGSAYYVDASSASAIAPNTPARPPNSAGTM